MIAVKDVVIFIDDYRWDFVSSTYGTTERLNGLPITRPPNWSTGVNAPDSNNSCGVRPSRIGAVASSILHRFTHSGLMPPVV